MEVKKVLQDENCTKLIISLDDGYLIENCFKYPFWICVTTQVGCPIHCTFCQSGKNGFIRNLTSNEILEQIKISMQYAIGEYSDELLFYTVSFTGMGEPLINIDNVFDAIYEVQNRSDSEITLTTTGINSGIQRLFFTQRKITLDISLHAIFPEKRINIIPSEEVNPIIETIKFVLNNKKRFKKVVFDYLLLDGINDSDNDLNQLIACFANKRASIELIKYNTIIENDIYKASEPEVFQRFYTELNKNGIETIIEENVGIELKAGCGQLIWKYSEVTTNENMFSIRKNTTTEANGNY